MSSPGYRNWLMIRRVAGKDSMVDSVLNDCVDSRIIKEAKDIFLDKIVRIYVEAGLLASEDFDALSEILEIDKYVLMFYHDIYYDVHSLSRIHKVNHLAGIEDEDERNLKQWAMTNGIGFIKWRLGVGHKLSLQESLIDLQSDAYFRSKEAFFNSNTAEASQEGLKWSRQATTLAKLLSDISVDEDDAKAEFELALNKITEDDLELPSIANLREEP